MVQKLRVDLDETFWQKWILPEEDRRNRPVPPLWNGSYRWFRSPNIVDLWHYRSPAEKRQITDFMWQLYNVQTRAVAHGSD